MRSTAVTRSGNAVGGICTRSENDLPRSCRSARTCSPTRTITRCGAEWRSAGDEAEGHLARRRRDDRGRRERRSVDHALIMAILAHLDLDAFFAAVEELEQPELRRKPLVVGGDPKGRGVVSTANYVARRSGSTPR